VEGEGKDKGHVDDPTSKALDPNTVPQRLWNEWESSRLRKIKREERRKREFERAFGKTGFHSVNGGQGTEEDGASSYGVQDDMLSMANSEDDRWGPQVCASDAVVVEQEVVLTGLRADRGVPGRYTRSCGTADWAVSRARCGWPFVPPFTA
jgi:hypothetical protein